MRKTRAAVVCLSLAGIGFGQASFEVASIKSHPGIVTFSSDPRVRGSRVVATASTLLDMITAAYQVRYEEIAGAPGWASSEHYDLDAKAGDAAVTDEQMRIMLQTLLADRFQLRIHRETRLVPVFALVVGKHGPKFRESSAEEESKGSIRGSAKGFHLEGARQTMARLAAQLAGNGAGGPVTDHTGLTGLYTFQLDWAPASAAAVSDVPTLAVALQEQLGLKLEPAKGPVQFIVIDHVEKPSAN